MRRLSAGLLFLLLAACVQPAQPAAVDAVPFEACAHPYPCGNEWPEALQGPFAVKETRKVVLKSHDQQPLETYVFLPKVPDGVKVPVLLWSTPYPGSCASNALACFAPGDNPQSSTRIDVKRVVEAGYAVAVANVRGTGNSGGCFEYGGRNEQKDQAFLVEWLAKQPWSNGRIGMYGHSYVSYTAWMGAVESPPGLKTVIVSGLMTDGYTTVHTPQGAAAQDGGWFLAGYASSLGLIPPLGGSPQHWSVDHAGVIPARLCPGIVEHTFETQRGSLVDARNEAFWAERRLVSRFPQVQPAVFVVSGFEDSAMLFHGFQDDDVWSTIQQAPKRMTLGHWGHTLPPPQASLNLAPFGKDWYDDTLLPWLDFWLKGLGDAPPRIGLVDYEDSSKAWRTTTSWPPAEAAPEVLYLAGGALQPGAGTASATLRLAPDRDGSVCSRSVRLFATPPVEAPVRIAGNTFAYLRITSDQPGGIIALDLYDVGPRASCDATSGPEARWLAGGAADLRFHAATLRGQAFPTGAPTMVRVDINNQAWTIEPGHRLALAVNANGYHPRIGQPYAPQVTIHADGGDGASHLVVPVVEGTFGGGAPTLDYPPRPFLPLAS